MFPLALALLSCDAGPAVVPRQAALQRLAVAAEPAGSSVEGQIKSAYTLAADTASSREDRDAVQIRDIVRRRVNAGLLQASIAMHSRDFFFTPDDRMERHFGVFTLRYPDAATARARYGTIAKQRFFENSKILIPMISATRGADVLIFYTESGLDPKLRALLADVARTAATGDGSTAAGG